MEIGIMAPVLGNNLWSPVVKFQAFEGEFFLRVLCPTLLSYKKSPIGHMIVLVRILLSAFFLLSLTLPGFAEPVKDAVAAEKIGAAALKEKILGNYDHYMLDLSWQATLRGDTWFAMPVAPTNIGADLMEQNGWIVQIDARNGKVLGVYLQF